MPSFDLELAAMAEGHAIIAGVDEAGRGPLFGEVTAAACILPNQAPPELLKLLNDSKKLTARARGAADVAIRELCVFGIGSASVEEIDRLNILQATFLAMRRAVAALPTQPMMVLIDGNQRPGISGIAERTVIKGDGLSYSIAAASILAKEHRDRLMEELGRRYPQYGLDRNAGYGTAEHLAALTLHGPCPEHRTSFAPVRRAMEDRAARAA